MDLQTFWKRSSGEIITYTEGNLVDIIQRARNDINSLITNAEQMQEKLDLQTEPLSEVVQFWVDACAEKDALIESQKEEIERNEEIIEQYTKVMNDRKTEFDSLKAITELAVQWLSEIASGGLTADSHIVIAQSALAEIERLSK